MIVGFSLSAWAGVADLHGQEGTWRGQRQVSFQHEGRAAWVVIPPKAAPGNPWVWRARFPGFHAEVDDELIKRGYHVAHINTAGMLGSPAAMLVWDGFYDRMINTLDLNPKVVLEGVSRGGLFIYNWAARHPDRGGVHVCGYSGVGL